MWYSNKLWTSRKFIFKHKFGKKRLSQGPCGWWDGVWELVGLGFLDPSQGVGSPKVVSPWFHCVSDSVTSDSSPPASSVPGVLQARILDWVAIPFSRGSSWLRDWTLVSCLIGRFFAIWTTRKSWMYCLSKRWSSVWKIQQQAFLRHAENTT